MEIGQLLLALFAVFGVYALAVRVFVLLVGRKVITPAIRLQGTETEEEILTLLSQIRLLAERCPSMEGAAVVLLPQDASAELVQLLRRRDIPFFISVE